MLPFSRKKQAQKKEKKQGQNFNSIIAKAHRLQRKSVGLIVAAGGVLAFTLSFLLIVTGIVMTALLRPITTNVIGLSIYVIIWTIAAFMIGILIERLTASNSTKLRIMQEHVDEIDARLSQIEGEPTEATLESFDLQKTEAQKGKRTIIFLIVLGTSLSMLCESFSIHFLFSSWDPYTGWIASFFLSGLVSYTLISSELHKKHEAGIIRDSLDTDDFLGNAAQATIKDKVHELMLTQAAVKVEQITTDSSVLLQAIDQAVLNHIDDVMKGNGEIVERITDEREQERLRIAQDQERTRQQLSIIRGNNAPEPVGSTAVVATFNNPQPQKSKNYLTIEKRYRESGEQLFTTRYKNRLARAMGIKLRSVDRILAQVKEEVEGESA